MSGTRMSRDEFYKPSDHILASHSTPVGKSYQLLYDNINNSNSSLNHLTNIELLDTDNDQLSVGGSMSVPQKKVMNSPSKKGMVKNVSGTGGLINSGGINRVTDEIPSVHENKNGSRVTLVKSVIYNDIKKAKTLSNNVFEENNYPSKDVSMVLHSIRNRRTGAGGIATTELQEYCHRVRGNSILLEDASYEFGHNPALNSESDARSDGGDSVASVTKGVRRVSRLSIPKRVEGR